MGTRPGQPKLEDAVWIALLERYVRGETQAALGREHGVSVSAIAWQARNRGYRKRDRPDAVYRWVQPPPITPAPALDEGCGWDFDPDDLAGSEARALETARRAAREGRVGRFRGPGPRCPRPSCGSRGPLRRACPCRAPCP